MVEPIAYLKGEFVPNSQCVLNIYDLGIVLGAAVTDFVRTFTTSSSTPDREYSPSGPTTVDRELRAETVIG